jgi:Excalibur calcium-binding domain
MQPNGLSRDFACIATRLAFVGNKFFKSRLWLFWSRVLEAVINCVFRASVSALVAAFIFTDFVWAHGGGLNADGCHNDRKLGDYHCHRGGNAKLPLPINPVVTPRSGLVPQIPRGYVFRNCAEARAAGAAPLRRGEPGYGPHLDRDNDGIGCE